MAPPLTLTFSRSRPSSFSTARYCAANASLTSIEIDVVERQPGLLEHRARRRRRPHAHQRRLDADRRPVRRAARAAVSPCALTPLRRREQQRGAAVDDAAGVAGRDAAVLAERRRQLRQPLHRRVRTHVIVLREDARRPCAILISTGTTSSVEAARLPGLVARAAGCAARSVLLLARDAVLRRAVLGRAAIVQPQCVSSSADHSVSSSCPGRAAGRCAGRG